MIAFMIGTMMVTMAMFAHAEGDHEITTLLEAKIQVPGWCIDYGTKCQPMGPPRAAANFWTMTFHHKNGLMPLIEGLDFIWGIEYYLQTNEGVITGKPEKEGEDPPRIFYPDAIQIWNPEIYAYHILVHMGKGRYEVAKMQPPPVDLLDQANPKAIEELMKQQKKPPADIDQG